MVSGFTNANGFGGTPPASCNMDGCEYKATLLLDLGGSFSVLASGNSVWPGIRGADGGATVDFALFEADGATPVVLTPVSSASAPPTSGLPLFGFALAGGSLLRRTLSMKNC